MMAAVESIASPHGKRTDDTWVLDHLPWILGALYLYIWRSVYGPSDVNQVTYAQIRIAVFQSLKHARETVSLPGVDQADAWEGWRATGTRDLDSAVKAVAQRGWLEQDWVQGVDDLVQSRAREALEEPTSGVAGGDQNMRAAANTMFQNRYDYLSRRNLSDLATWKSSILERIKSLEHDPGAQVDIDA